MAFIHRHPCRLSRRNLERRFKKPLEYSGEYIQRKIEAAKRVLNYLKKMNEVMYKAGYTDTKAFRTTFKNHRLSPMQYRNKYAKSE
jgi:transcriptional regulator GlxA family with amidase domain